MKTTFIVVGFVEHTNEIVFLQEYNNKHEAELYKSRYESRISIYDSFEVMKETYPDKFISYQDYMIHKYKK